MNSEKREVVKTISKEFDGDIIITDPCYVIRNSDELTDDDWEECECGFAMEQLGIKNYLTHDTLYGDWGCTVFNSDTNKAIGSFCADAGMVSVFLLIEILAYNPKFDYHTEKPWTTALIKDFKGTVSIVVSHVTGTFDDDSEYWKAGDPYEDDEVSVVGHGINKVTGEPINFFSAQTSL